MKRYILTTLAIFVTTTLAEEAKQTVPEQAAPVYGYVKAMLAGDIETFKKVHTKRSLAAYEQAGGIDTLFPKFSAEFIKTYKGAALADFSFTAKPEKYAVPGGPIELDGEYYMVQFQVEKIGGGGVFVEREGQQWKITIPRYKNLEEVMKKAKAMEQVAPNKTSEPSVAPAPQVQH